MLQPPGPSTPAQGKYAGKDRQPVAEQPEGDDRGKCGGCGRARVGESGKQGHFQRAEAGWCGDDSCYHAGGEIGAGDTKQRQVYTVCVQRGRKSQQMRSLAAQRGSYQD